MAKVVFNEKNGSVYEKNLNIENEGIKKIECLNLTEVAGTAMMTMIILVERKGKGNIDDFIERDPKQPFESRIKCGRH